MSRNLTLTIKLSIGALLIFAAYFGKDQFRSSDKMGPSFKHNHIFKQESGLKMTKKLMSPLKVEISKLSLEPITTEHDFILRYLTQRRKDARKRLKEILSFEFWILNGRKEIAARKLERRKEDKKFKK